MTLEDEIYRTETFGPIVGVATFSTFDEAMELANRHGYGLSSSIYTTSGTNAFRFRERITAGMVSVNNSTSGAEAHLPFGGNGKSGNGSRQSGIWVLDQFTRWQSMNWDYAGKLQKAQMDNVAIEADDAASGCDAQAHATSPVSRRGRAPGARPPRRAPPARPSPAARAARRSPRAACPSSPAATARRRAPSTSTTPGPPSIFHTRLRTASSGISSSRSRAASSGSRFASSRTPVGGGRVGERPASSASSQAPPAVHRHLGELARPLPQRPRVGGPSPAQAANSGGRDGP